MKKLLVIASLISIAMLTSCDNDNSVNPKSLGKAKITGTVYAEFDYTNNDTEFTYNKVSNKKMIVLVWDEYSDNDSGYRAFETTTDAEGNYSIEVPVGNRELEVGIKLVDFKQVVKHDDGDEEEVFYGDGFWADVDVIKGDEYIRDIYYND